jgi:hypothetical protein
MNKVGKYALIIFSVNVLTYILFIAITVAFGDNLEVALTMLFLIPIIMLLGELILGIIFAFSQSKKELGQGMLIGLGATLLIGLSVCGVLAGGM